MYSIVYICILLIINIVRFIIILKLRLRFFAYYMCTYIEWLTLTWRHSERKSDIFSNTLYISFHSSTYIRVPSIQPEIKYVVKAYLLSLIGSFKNMRRIEVCQVYFLCIPIVYHKFLSIGNVYDQINKFRRKERANALIIFKIFMLKLQQNLYVEITVKSRAIYNTVSL